MKNTGSTYISSLFNHYPRTNYVTCLEVTSTFDIHHNCHANGGLTIYIYIHNKMTLLSHFELANK